MATPNYDEPPTLTKKQRAAALLKESIKCVMREAFHMKRAMDQEDLRLALKHASQMLGELRTSALSPMNYYELYMKVCDELMYLEMFFREQTESGKEDIVALYQRVQNCGNVLPRLYLLFCVGGIYIKSKKGVCKDILKDMVEMGKGVQHPTRGLFLRNYLSTISKDKLPDKGSDYEGEGGDTDDAVEFVLQNFCEMNRLWVRMQSQGKVKKKKKREKERQQLKLLVGTNLVRLSHLDGVTLEGYKDNVLPKILEEVVNCKDPIAQFYLMDCIIQVFPDEFHLGTLETFLTQCTALSEEVDVKSILIRLMDRIAQYIKSGSAKIPDDAFSMFNKYVAETLKTHQATMEVNDILELQIALLNFSNSCYPGKLDYVDHILGFSAQVLGRLVGAGSKVPAESEEFVQTLLTTPLETLSLNVLKLEKFAPLMATLPFAPRKNVAVQMLRAVVDVEGSRVDSLKMCEQLLTFISPLVRDEDDTPAINMGEQLSDDGEGSDADGSPDEFTVEQRLVSRLVALFENEDTDVLFQIYNLARKAFGKGGMRRIRFTLVPLTFGYFRLARRIHQRERQIARAKAKNAKAAEELAIYFSNFRDEEAPPAPEAPKTVAVPEAPKVGSKKIYQHIHGLITALAGVDEYQTMALSMFLEASRSAGECQYEAIAYEFVTRAFALYEDTADSKAQVRALLEMIGTLQVSNVFGEDNYDTLITNTTKYAAKLLKKTDQCRMVAQCAHLFWTGRPAAGKEPKRLADDNRALECLKKSLKIADGIMDPVANVELFIDILNEYLYYYSQECPRIEVKYVKGLLNLIREHMSDLDNEGAEQAKARFETTLRHIKKKGKEEKRYASIIS